MHAQSGTLPQQFNIRADHEGWPSVCDERLRFDAPALEELLGLWRGAALGLAMPRRSQITTRVLGHHLPDVSIIDYVESKIGPHRYRFRLFGSRLARMSGDLRGKHFDEVVEPAVAEAWTLGADTVMRFGAPLRFVSEYRVPHVGLYKAESFMAPLCDAHGTPTSLLSSIVYTKTAELAA